ncbi:MAG: leucine-rich repeat domain-containing protein [Anaeroplasmataceae bacterium]|nr:leucine-rich repeat domain-containing protein [Anaeroplasmataceae bacterium]
MKKIFIILVLIVILSGCSSFAGNTSTGSSSDGTFSFKGSEIRALNTSISGDIIIPETYNGVTIDTIPANAFKGCSEITSIVVPNTITTIEANAFQGCIQLKSMTLPFVGSKRGSIANAQFGYIFGKQKMDGTEETVQIYGSNSNSSFTWYIPKSLRKVKITNETILATGAFCNCKYLTSIELNDEIHTVSNYAFKGCENLEKLSLPSANDISYGMCEDCTSLTEVIVNEELSTIGGNAFFNCSSLNKINSSNEGEFLIPDSVTSIEGNAFHGCISVKSITLPFIGCKKGNKNAQHCVASFGYIFGYGRGNDEGCFTVKQFYEDHWNAFRTFFIPKSLKEVKITNESIIGYGAFQNCSMLETLLINKEASNTIGDKAFENCIKPTYF